ELRHDPDEEMFLVSTRSEEQIVRAYAWKAFASLLGGWLLGLATPVAHVVSARGVPVGIALEASVLPMLLVTAGFWLVVLGLYLQLVYNGLVEVRNRLKRAFSMIDVELQRRRDLIPNLARVVGATAEHERETQAAAAELRSAPMGGMPDVAGAVA